MLYDAFISYSHAKDKPIAAALQSVVQKLGKPWYRRRALRVFRDDTSLSATPHLWPSIEKALGESRYLILLASPEAATSPWIEQEVKYWLTHKSADALFIGLTDGTLTWDGKKGDFRSSRRSPLPKILKGRFVSEPKWVDLRAYRDGADPQNARFIELGADFTAAIRGMPKEDLLSQEVRQQRRALTLAMGAAASLLVLAGAAGWQWTIAEWQRSRAEAEADRAEKQTVLAQENEQFAKTQQKIAEDSAFDARLRAQAAEARVLQQTDPHAALKLIARTLEENLSSEKTVFPEVFASTFSALQVARKLKVVDPGFHGQFNNISSISVTPDEDLIAVGTVDMIHILESDGRPAVPPIPGPGGRFIYANQLSWDSSGALLAVASGGVVAKTVINAALRLYDRQGKQVRTLVENHDVPIVSVTFVPKQNVILAGDTQGRLIRVDLDTGATRILSSGQTSPIHGMAWTDRGLSLAVGPPQDVTGDPQDPSLDEEFGDLTDEEPLDPDKAFETEAKADESDDAIARTLELTSQAQVEIVSDSAAQGLVCIATLTGGQAWSGSLATCGADGNVNLWHAYTDSRRYSLRRSLRGHVGAVYSVALFNHPNGEVVATGGADGEIRLWNAASGSLLVPPLSAHDGGVRALAFTNGGKTLVSGGNDGSLIMWDTADLGGEAFRHSASGDFVQIGDENTLFIAKNEFNGGWEIVESKQPAGDSNGVTTLFGPGPGTIEGFAIDPQAEKLAWTDQNLLHIGDGAERRELFKFEVNKAHATHVAFGHESRRLAVVGSAQDEWGNAEAGNSKATSLTFIDLLTETPIDVVENPHAGNVAILAGNPSLTGAAFASAGDDGTFKLWSFQGELLKESRFATGSVFADNIKIAFAPNGRYAALAWPTSAGTSLFLYQLWDTLKLTPFAEPTRIQGKIDAIGFSPNGDAFVLATSQRDLIDANHAIHIHSLQGAPLATIQTLHQFEIDAVSFDHNGLVVSANSLGEVRRWPIGPTNLLEIAKARDEAAVADAQEAVDALIDSSGMAIDENDWEAVAKLMEEARSIDPENAMVRIRLGNAYAFQDKPRLDEASAEYGKAIDLAPFDPIGYLQRGKFRLRHSDPAGAAEDFTQGLRYGHLYIRHVPPVIADFIPINIQVHYFNWMNQAHGTLWFNQLRGRAHLAMGKWQEAESDLTLATEGSPKQRAAQAAALEVATRLSVEGDANKSHFDGWAANLRKQMAAPGGDYTPEMHELRARARAEQGKFDEAIADLRVAIKLLDDLERPYSFEEAYGGKMKDVARRARKQGELHGKLASIYSSMEDRDATKAERLAAIAALDRAHELAPQNPWILAERGRAKLNADKERDEYLDDYLAAVAVDPSNAGPYDYLVQILIWLEDYPRAYDTTAKALRILPEPTATLRARHAIATWRLGMREQAHQAWIQLKSDYPDLSAELSRGLAPLWPNELAAARDLEALSEAPSKDTTHVEAGSVQ